MNEIKTLDTLNSILESYGKCAIAFSGGVDSTFLLAAAERVLGKENVVAITVVPPYVADWEIEEAIELATDLGVQHINLKAVMLDEIKNNPENRCYICKTALFSLMLDECKKLDISILCDGSNADDMGDYRPGMKALKELGINSPLLQAGMTKQEIRDNSKDWELDTWDKPPYACLLTRMPHNTEVSKTILNRIEKSEVVMINNGFPYVRVRDHGDIARIEIPKDQFAAFLNSEKHESIISEIKETGYKFVTLDLNGYKMGNMNQTGEKNG